MWNTKWKGACAESIGALHIKQKLPMQDSHSMHLSKNYFAATVSDGLGSKPHSDFGSYLACRIFVKLAKNWAKSGTENTKELLDLFVTKWISKIRALHFEIKDCSTTFLGVIFFKETLYLFQLGDGMICALFDDESKNIVMSDEKEGAFSNMTKALKEKILFEDWKINVLNAKDLKSVFLCSDGISDDLQKGAELSFVSEMAKQYFAKSQRKIKKDMNHWISNWPVPKHSDDKTAIFICRKK